MFADKFQASPSLFPFSPMSGWTEKKAWVLPSFQCSLSLQMLVPPPITIKTLSQSLYLCSQAILDHFECYSPLPRKPLYVNSKSFLCPPRVCVCVVSLNIQTKFWVGCLVYFCRITTTELLREHNKKLQTDKSQKRG